MRYAIISDIHANLTALQGVLSDISKLNIDKIICLGDTLGYGPQPAETLEMVYQVAECHLLGNHDAAVCGKLNPIIFSESAKKAVIKHRGMISETALSWLKSMPLTLKTPSFRCTHGDFTKPGAYRYIIAEEDALPSFEATEEQLLFAGHSHLAGIYVIGASNVPHFLAPRDFILEDHKRYIINPGTVGYPRSGKFESTYCIFDSEERSIIFRHLPFDHIAFNNALRAAGFNEIPWIQAKTADLNLPDVRKHLSFKKPLADEYHIVETLKKIQLTHMEQIKKYRFLIIAIITLSLATGIFLVSHIFKPRSVASVLLRIPAENMDVIKIVRQNQLYNNFLYQLPGSAFTGEAIEGWRYTIADQKNQQISITQHSTGNSLRVTHTQPCQFAIESPLVLISDTDLKSLRMKGRIRKLDGFSGNVFYQLQHYMKTSGGALEKYKQDTFEVRGRSNEGADTAAITRKIALNRDTTHVRLSIEADFSGTLELRQPELYGHDDSIPTTKNSEGNIP